MIVRDKEVLLIASICLIILICPASAYHSSYSALSWMDAPPVGDAKLPVAVEVWEVPPSTALLVFTAIFFPVCLIPLEIFISCAGMIMLNFRRIQRTDIFKNEWRSRIYEYIVANPGAGFTEIECDLPVNRGTLNYHLGILHRERLIVAFCKNKRTFYFENAGKYSDTEMEAIALLRNNADFSICEYLSSSSDASRRDIAQKMKTTRSTVSWHMHRLCEAGLISSEKKGRRVHYRLTSVATKALDEMVCAGSE